MFNVGSSEEITILQLAQRVIEKTGGASTVRMMPHSEFYGEGYADMQRRVPNTGKINAALGWVHTRSLDVILDETIAEARAEFPLAACPAA